jgi:hypothetical protein
MVVTDGDHFAELIKAEQLGIVVPAKNVAALTDALEKVLFDPKFAAKARKNVAKAQKRYTWEVVLAPLVEFVASPRHAADYVPPRFGKGGKGKAPKPKKHRKRAGIRHDVRQSLYHLRNGGPLVVLGKVRNRLRLGS